MTDIKKFEEVINKEMFEALVNTIANSRLLKDEIMSLEICKYDKDAWWNAVKAKRIENYKNIGKNLYGYDGFGGRISKDIDFLSSSKHFLEFYNCVSEVDVYSEIEEIKKIREERNKLEEVTNKIEIEIQDALNVPKLLEIAEKYKNTKTSYRLSSIFSTVFRNNVTNVIDKEKFEAKNNLLQLNEKSLRRKI